MLKKVGFLLLAIVLIIGGSVTWFIRLLGDELTYDYSQHRPEQIPYITNAIDESRGRILAVVTSTEFIGETTRKTGYELTELSRAYYVFRVNGFAVDVASIRGGKPPMVLDADDMGPFDYAFLNDKGAMSKVENSMPIDEVDPQKYDAIYFVGGKGTMFDFPNNRHVQALVNYFWKQQKVIAAVCHGPAAFVNVQSENGDFFVAKKALSSFTNDEELFLIPKAKEIFPFLLQSKLEERGADFIAGENYLNNVVVDGNLITGQNPWSVWELAESTIRALGYSPVQRMFTAEENSIQALGIYATSGYDEAHSFVVSINQNAEQEVSRLSLATHAVVALINSEFKRAARILMLLNAIE